MLIDWFTVAAQIVNFLILVYLLKRFLYKPIVQHMNAREENIRERLNQATEREEKAREKIEEYRRMEEDLEKQSGRRLEQAEKEGQKRKKEIIAKSREEAEEKRRSWLQALRKDKDTFAHELKKRSASEVLRVVQKMLQDFGDASLNNRLAGVLTDRIRNLDEDARKKLSQACGSGKIKVRSTFKLEDSNKKEITALLHEFCTEEAETVYVADRDFPLGVEISAGSVRFSWGAESYLDRLKERIFGLIEEQAHGEDEPAEAKDREGFSPPESAVESEDHENG